MIWVDGYKWPPDLHGTGSEDYLNQAWGMQDNAFLRNGSSIFEGNHLIESRHRLWQGHHGGAYQTGYVYHIENPVNFQSEIKVTIEHGHGNHLRNEMASTAYWYAEKATKVARPPSAKKRMPILRNTHGNWIINKLNQCPGRPIPVNAEMKRMKARWAKRDR